MRLGTLPSGTTGIEYSYTLTDALPRRRGVPAMAEVAALTLIGIFVGLALLIRHKNRSQD
ncbi:hypothetical protein [Nocardia sp. NBC_00403]|uniref:hypothetical protein n=1 Tax=Nocardia sp. NBC_00403 TaxID=2975990 RepID=UPI002E1CC869